MKQWIDESGQEYGFDTHDMHLFKDEEMTMEFSINSITKEQLAKIIGGEPIIRCKDCKHSVDYYNDGQCYCRNENYNGNSLIYISGGWNHYCGYAERKSE